MRITSKPTTEVKPSTTASGTIARQGQWYLPMEWYVINSCLDGLVSVADVLQVLGRPQIGFDLPREKNYGNG